MTTPSSHSTAPSDKAAGKPIGKAAGKASGAAVPSAVMPWPNLTAAFLRHFYQPDLQAIRAVFAAFAAHSLTRGQPVWPLLICSSGSMKSATLESVDGLPTVYLIDQISSKTFLSGLKGEDDIIGVNGGAVGGAFRPGDDQPDPASPSLLRRIGPSGKIVCSDFSTILSMNLNHRNVLFSDLRKIYDGKLRKEFGSGCLPQEWHGRITFMSACTPNIDRHFAVFGALGERFILIRWPRAGEEAAELAIEQDMPKVKREISAAAHLLLTDLEPVEPSGPPEMAKKWLPALGNFISYGRSHVDRESWGRKEIVGVPEAESATRISQQLWQLAKGSALLDRRAEVNAEDWQMVLRVAFDCLPPARRKVLDALIEELAEDWTSDNAHALCDELPESTRRYAREDLTALGVLDRHDRLSERSIRQLSRVGILRTGKEPA